MRITLSLALALVAASGCANLDTSGDGTFETTNDSGGQQDDRAMQQSADTALPDDGGDDLVMEPDLAMADMASLPDVAMFPPDVAMMGPPDIVMAPRDVAMPHDVAMAPPDVAMA